MFGPIPQNRMSGNVVLDSIPLMLVEGSYVVDEAERFADKISTSQLNYTDFRPFEQAWDVSSLAAGYGLRRYTDLPGGSTTPMQGIRREMYKEAEGVDCREHGIVTLGPEISVSATALTGTPLWIGEFAQAAGADAGVTKLVVVTSDGKVYTVASTLVMTLVITLPANPVRAAIGSFNGRMFFGYGATRTAQFTDDLSTLQNVTNTTPANLYAWAYTSDRASAYIAGGPATTDGNKVTSSTHGGTGYSTTLVTCESSETKITELAPGGGIVLLFVGKEDRLGMIDNSSPSLFRTLIPFDSRLSTNCNFLAFWMGGFGEEQRGPVVLFFPREQALWSYQPTSEFAGDAKNMSPWALPGIRPPNIRGRPTAIQGSARWLYYTITSAATGDYWVLCQDARTGATHGGLIDLGTNQCQALAISNLYWTNPRLLYGYGNGLAVSILPLDGDSPVDDPAARFTASGTLDLPDIDFEFPDEPKILFSIRVISDDLVPASRTIAVRASYDGAAYVLLGTVSVSPSQELQFPAATNVRRVGLRFTLTTDASTATPKLLAVVLRGSINPKLYRIWGFQVKLPTGSLASMTDDLQNPYTVLSNLWAARTAGTPVTFKDRWADTWTVRILRLREAETIREPQSVPETVLDVQLLEVQREASGSFVYDDAAAIYDAVNVTYVSG